VLIAKVVSMWSDIETALTPIIGHRGVAALFDRTCHLTRPDHPWLTPPHQSADGRIDLAALQSLFSQPTSDRVLSANGALLQKFSELLGNLIGSGLTERLLRPVVDTHSTGDAA